MSYTPNAQYINALEELWKTCSRLMDNLYLSNDEESRHKVLFLQLQMALNNIAQFKKDDIWVSAPRVVFYRYHCNCGYDVVRNLGTYTNDQKINKTLVCSNHNTLINVVAPSTKTFLDTTHWTSCPLCNENNHNEWDMVTCPSCGEHNNGIIEQIN